MIYGVTAVNNSAQESPPRQVNVYPVALGLLANPRLAAPSNPLMTGYFDQYQVGHQQHRAQPALSRSPS